MRSPKLYMILILRLKTSKGCSEEVRHRRMNRDVEDKHGKSNDLDFVPRVDIRVEYQ